MKKNLKKLVALGLVATTGTTLLAGCWWKRQRRKQRWKVELVMSVWDSDQEPVMKQMAEAYSKENPNVTVKTQLTTWNEYWTKLEASATGGSAPDIITMNVLHVEEYADAGILMDLTDAEKESDLKVHDNFPAPLVDGYTVEGKLYGIPKDFDTNAVFYNKEIFDRVGIENPPKTLEEMVEDAKLITAELAGEGIYGFAENMKSASSGLKSFHDRWTSERDWSAKGI